MKTYLRRHKNHDAVEVPPTMTHLALEEELSHRSEMISASRLVGFGGGVLGAALAEVIIDAIPQEVSYRTIGISVAIGAVAGYEILKETSFLYISRRMRNLNRRVKSIESSQR